MFAVKGWSVDASTLKPQTEIFKSADGSSSKKRKRKHHPEVKQDPNVRADDVGRLWAQHVEGQDPSKSQKHRERKKQKLDKTADVKKDADVQQNDRGKTKALSGPAVKHATEATPAEGSGEAQLSGKQKKKLRREQRAAEQKSSEKDALKALAATVNGKQNDSAAKAVPPAPSLPATAKLTPMQSAMRQKLISSRFRYLNQTLYTEPSTKAQKLFDQDPAMFEDYHAGFRQQVSSWPENPVDKFVAEVRRRGNVKPAGAPKGRRKNMNYVPIDSTGQALPRTHGTCIIADMGCGDAKFAQTLTVSNEMKTLNLKIHSFDLHSPSPLVTKADISQVPLENGSIDVAIFCLALMGTNWISFIEEAYRILHWKGELWIAEIKSRFGRVSKGPKTVEHSVGNKKKLLALQKAKEAKKLEDQEVNEQEVLQTEVDGVQADKQETDVSAFVEVLKRRGFALKAHADRAVDMQNRMFVKMEFVKALEPTKGKNVSKEQPKVQAAGVGKMKKKFIADEEEEPSTEDEGGVLKPCLYKIR